MRIQLPPVARFAIVGIGNTIAGLLVILLALRVGLDDVTANLCGYLVGLLLGFALNRNWTFTMAGRTSGWEVARYLMAFSISWLANIAVITFGVRIGLAGSAVLHLAGICVYTACFYALSHYFVFSSTGNRPLFNVSWRYPGEALVLPLTVVAMVALRGIDLTHDVEWQLWIAKQMQHGVKLYSQINELNPPLWFWMAVPVQQLASLLPGVTPEQALIAAICLLALTSSLLVGQVGQFDGPSQRAWAMTATLFVGLCISLYNFGQREQIVLIVSIPYAFLIAARLDGRKSSGSTAFAIAILASLGFALKHYFAIVPLGLEALLLVRQRRAYAPFRIETMVLAAAALIYALVIIFITPDFVRHIVPMVRLAYGGFESPFWMMFDEPEQVLWALTCLALFMAGGRRILAGQTISQTLAVSACGFFIAYLVQRKGWQYHAVATSGMLVLLLASLGFAPTRRVRDILAHPMACLCIGLFFTLSFAQGPYVNNRRDLVNALVKDVPAGGSVMIIASNPMWGWPTIEKHHLTWASRYFAHWMLPAIGRARADGDRDPSMYALERVVKNETYEDIVCSAPAMILIENREPNFVFRPANFDTLSFFREDARFRSYLESNYRQDAAGHWLRVFRRITRQEPRPEGCRHIW